MELRGPLVVSYNTLVGFLMSFFIFITRWWFYFFSLYFVVIFNFYNTLVVLSLILSFLFLSCYFYNTLVVGGQFVATLVCGAFAEVHEGW